MVFLGWVSDSLFTPECDAGDANGSPQDNMGQQTRQECQENALAAGSNAFTTHASCPADCGCYAEFNSDSRNGNTNWYSCIFYPG